MRTLSHSSGAAALCLLTACAGGPATPDWQLEAKSAMDRAVAAYLEGDSRIEQAEMTRARAALQRTGRADLLANAELLRCATRVASLVYEPCTGFEVLRQDTTAPQRAYADYLSGQLQPQDAVLLPEAQRGVAAGNVAAALRQNDPLSQLVVAGVLLRSGNASPDVSAEAITTASSQGWRRPLLAWLALQQRQAEQGRRPEEAARLQRRIAIVEGRPASASKAKP